MTEARRLGTLLGLQPQCSSARGSSQAKAAQRRLKVQQHRQASPRAGDTAAGLLHRNPPRTKETRDVAEETLPRLRRPLIRRRVEELIQGEKILRSHKERLSMRRAISL